MPAIHVSPVAPTDLKKFNKFIEKRAGLILNVEIHQHRDELDGKSCIIPNDLVRDTLTGGVIPDIFDADENKWRTKICKQLFASNDIAGAIHKYRTAHDRHMHHGNHGRTGLSKYCYGYIIKVENLRLAGFGGVGIARCQTSNHENFGQSEFPVKPSGCYKITWNGHGICNATFSYVPH
jgi:hypothetical protein